MSYPVLPCHVVVCASTQQRYFVVNDSMFWLLLQTYLASGAEIQQLALVESSSSLHSEACNALGVSDGVIHSRIS